MCGHCGTIYRAIISYDMRKISLDVTYYWHIEMPCVVCYTIPSDALRPTVIAVHRSDGNTPIGARSPNNDAPCDCDEAVAVVAAMIMATMMTNSKRRHWSHMLCDGNDIMVWPPICSKPQIIRKSHQRASDLSLNDQRARSNMRGYGHVRVWLKEHFFFSSVFRVIDDHN